MKLSYVKSYTILISAILASTLLTMPTTAAIPIGAIIANSTPHEWTLNIDKTNVNFTVRYLGKLNLKGTFHDVNGSIHYNEARPQDTTVNFTVRTESVDTDLKPRDLFLRRKELLNTQQYPTMQFVSSKIDLITASEGYVTGNFTALGQTHPLTVRVTLQKKPSSTAQQPVLLFTAIGSINRLTYGATAFPNMIGNIIPINISGELVPTH